MTLGANTSQGQEVINYSYGLVYASHSVSSTTYKVDFGYRVQMASESITAWVMSNGTVLAVESSGQNITGSSASDYLLVSASPFILLGEYNSSPASSDLPFSQLHAAGLENVTLGDVNMIVTDYQANSLPLVYSDCLGDTYTLSTFLLQQGTVPGTSFTLLTYLDMQGTMQQDSSASQSYGILLQVTSITLG